MHIDKLSEKGNKIRLSVTRKAAERLLTTAFRQEGRRQHLAGSFYFWDSPRQFFGDRWVHELLLWHADQLVEAGDEGSHSVTGTYRFWLGWESTDLLDKYDHSDLEEFNPNRRSRALRVRKDRYKIKAPPTKKVTIVFEFRLATKDHNHLVIIHSVYPGEDIGELAGDVTERERRNFFDWGHRGADFPG